MQLVITVQFNDDDGVHMEENLNKAIDDLSKTLKKKGLREMELTGVNMELQEMYKVTIKKEAGLSE